MLIPSERWDHKTLPLCRMSELCNLTSELKYLYDQHLGLLYQYQQTRVWKSQRNQICNIMTFWLVTCPDWPFSTWILGKYDTLSHLGFWLIVLGFNDTSTLVGHFVSSPTEREKRDRRGGEREGQGRKENEWQRRNIRNQNIPPLALPAARIAGLARL